MAETQPTPAAMRAASAITETETGRAWRGQPNRLAAIIDEETGLPELLGAAKAAEWGGPIVAGQLCCPVCRAQRDDGHSTDCVLAIGLAKAKREGE